MGVQIGTANIANLILVPGMNVVPTAVHYEPQGSAVATGQLLLENFVQRIVSTTIIQGTTSTTPIASLQQALSTIQLTTNIPPLEQNLITQAALELPTDVSTTGIGQTMPTLVDPFTAAININRLITSVVYPGGGGITIGNINLPSLNPALHVDGHSAAVLPALPININLDPRNLVRFLTAAAANQSVDLGPLVPYFQYVAGLSDAQVQNYSKVQTTPLLPLSNSPPGCNSAPQFDVLGTILAAVRNLYVTLQIQSTVHLDDYQTDLNFNQFNVAVIVRALADIHSLTIDRPMSRSSTSPVRSPSRSCSTLSTSRCSRSPVATSPRSPTPASKSL